MKIKQRHLAGKFCTRKFYLYIVFSLLPQILQPKSFFKHLENYYPTGYNFALVKCWSSNSPTQHLIFHIFKIVLSWYIAWICDEFNDERIYNWWLKSWLYILAIISMIIELWKYLRKKYKVKGISKKNAH